VDRRGTRDLGERGVTSAHGIVMNGRLAEA
jgi:hypothetical protein